MKIKKRDGRIVDFDKHKISEAIMKAMEQVGDINTRTAARIANEISKMDYEILDIEQVQDLVENKLMKSSYPNVARAYIRYRQDRERIRMWNNQLMDTMAEKLAAINVQNSNANLDENSFGGRKNEADSTILKQYALDNCMSEMSRNNHLHNEIYIHDLDSYALGMHNCLTMPIDDLLARGFNTRQTDVRPANSINTAMQLVAVLFQLQSLAQFGGVSAGHLDWTMVPYVRKSFYKHFRDGLNYVEVDDPFASEYINELSDKLSIEDDKYKKYPYSYKYAMDMTKKELKQAVEGMFHNLNTLQSRSGNQLPFSSIKV